MDAQQIRQKLEDSGLRCTAQRYSVMSFLMGHHEHPTAAEIFEAVNRLDPRSSRAKDEQHYHFICDRCGSVEDIDWYTVPAPAARSLGKRVVRECELIIRGLCATCAPRKPS